MRFMMLVKAKKDCGEGGLPDEKSQSDMAAYNEQLVKAGALLAIERLHARSKGARVRSSAGKTAVTDGPFAETREQLGGFYLIEAKDLDEAARIAARIPSAKIGSIEIRPLMKFDGV